MKALAGAAFAIVILCAVWLASLAMTGGFDVHVFGLYIRSHDALRPTILGILSLGLFLWAGGRSLASERIARLRTMPPPKFDRYWWIVAAVIAFVVFACAMKYGSTVAGGSDAFGYISEADGWLAGQLKVRQPFVRQVPWPNASWTFTPLGYRPVDDGTVLVPTYAAGLPILMAAVKKVAGHAALFWIVPVSAFLTVMAAYALGKRFGASSYGAIAAWLVATSPPFLFQMVQPMTDVPVAAAWAWAFYFVLGSTNGSRVVAGLLTSVAILIRPNLAPLVAVPAMWLAYRRQWKSCAAFVAGVSPGAIAVALINQHLYGSPFLSGYGDVGGMFEWANVSTNLSHYSRWFVEYQTPVAIVGLLALALPMRRLWPRTADRSAVVMAALFVAGLWLFYCLYLVFYDWWYLRFLLAGWPFIMIGVASVLTPLLTGRAILRVIACLVVFAIGAHGVQIAIRQTFADFGISELKYATVGRLVAARTPPNSVIVAMQHSGSIRYYGGRMTFRYDNLDPRWLDRAVTWLNDHGAHPYALLEEWEIENVKQRFADQATIARFADEPMATYPNGGGVHLFDLMPAAPHGPTEIVTDDLRTSRAMPPAAPPTLTFRQPPSADRQ